MDGTKGNYQISLKVLEVSKKTAESKTGKVPNYRYIRRKTLNDPKLENLTTLHSKLLK